jgi:hypothetical protein
MLSTINTSRLGIDRSIVRRVFLLRLGYLVVSLPVTKKVHSLHESERQEFKPSFKSLMFCRTKVQADQCKSSP